MEPRRGEPAQREDGRHGGRPLQFSEDPLAKDAPATISLPRIHLTARTLDPLFCGLRSSNRL